YQQIFKKHNFETIVARDGAEGFETAIRTKPDFILSDVQLPKMSGMAMFEKLLNDQTGKNIPILFLTGKEAQTEERKKALEMGAKVYLAKGVDEPEEIVIKVKKY